MEWRIFNNLQLCEVFVSFLLMPADNQHLSIKTFPEGAVPICSSPFAFWDLCCLPNSVSTSLVMAG